MKSGGGNHSRRQKRHEMDYDDVWVASRCVAAWFVGLNTVNTFINSKFVLLGLSWRDTCFSLSPLFLRKSCNSIAMTVNLLPLLQQVCTCCVSACVRARAWRISSSDPPLAISIWECGDATSVSPLSAPHPPHRRCWASPTLAAFSSPPLTELASAACVTTRSPTFCSRCGA